MEIIIGRDEKTRKLKVAIGQQFVLIGMQDSVPMSVSRQHCSIELHDEEKYLIKNLNKENKTYVNGIPFEQKIVSEKDKIELGPDRYAVDWSALKKAIPNSEKMVDIRPLKKVWNDYDGFVKKQNKATQNFNNLRSATGMITMAAMVLGVTTGRENPLLIPLYVLAIVVSGIFTIIAFRNTSKNQEKMEEQKNMIEKKYRCPSCGRFMGYTSYNLLKDYPCCPHCRAKFKS